MLLLAYGVQMLDRGVPDCDPEEAARVLGLGREPPPRVLLEDVHEPRAGGDGGRVCRLYAIKSHGYVEDDCDLGEPQGFLRYGPRFEGDSAHMLAVFCRHQLTTRTCAYTRVFAENYGWVRCRVVCFLEKNIPNP